MLSILTDTQRAVIEVMTMRLHVPRALEYLDDAGHKMSRRKYFRQKKKIEEMKLERLQHIALHFTERHLEGIDKSELIEKLMWDNYYAEKDPTKKVGILNNIAAMQLTLSAYYDTTRYVLEKNWKTPIFKTKQPYVSINLEHEVEKEMDERADKRRWDIHNERLSAAKTQPVLVKDPSRPMLMAVKDVPVNDTPTEDQPEEQEQEQESEADLYWSTHGTPKSKPKTKLDYRTISDGF
jgi:hypothetical protein